MLGFDVDSSSMMILKAVMTASGGPSKFVTYKQIAEALQKKERKKKPYTKAYVYRHLTELEEEGFLVVDAVQKPRRYAISESAILTSLKKKREAALSELQAKKQEQFLINKGLIKPKVVVNFSGGKDSTAMLLRMIELGEHIDVIQFADTGYEFPLL